VKRPDEMINKDELRELLVKDELDLLNEVV